MRSEVLTAAGELKSKNKPDNLVWDFRLNNYKGLINIQNLYD
jgi:hypothetical protein